MFARLFTRFIADDSPASYYFMCAVATLIVGDAAVIYIYEAGELIRLALRHLFQ